MKTGIAHWYSLSASLLLLTFLMTSSVSPGRAQSAGSQATASPQPLAPILAARFVQSLNTKSAKAGDAIVAKTVKQLKLKDLEIPKGSKIFGTVIAARSKDAGGGNSSLAIRFDHVELKDSAILRIRGLIVAIAPVVESSGIGFDSVLGRGGGGYGSGLNPAAVAGEHTDDIPDGSSLEGVALGRNFDTEGATELRGVHREIKIDSSVMIKVALYRPT